jgi:hypothetical protein
MNLNSILRWVEMKPGGNRMPAACCHPRIYDREYTNAGQSSFAHSWTALPCHPRIHDREYTNAGQSPFVDGSTSPSTNIRSRIHECRSGAHSCIRVPFVDGTRPFVDGSTSPSTNIQSRIHECRSRAHSCIRVPFVDGSTSPSTNIRSRIHECRAGAHSRIRVPFVDGTRPFVHSCPIRGRHAPIRVFVSHSWTARAHSWTACHPRR